MTQGVSIFSDPACVERLLHFLADPRVRSRKVPVPELVAVALGTQNWNLNAVDRFNRALTRPNSWLQPVLAVYHFEPSMQVPDDSRWGSTRVQHLKFRRRRSPRNATTPNRGPP